MFFWEGFQVYDSLPLQSLPFSRAGTNNVSETGEFLSRYDYDGNENVMKNSRI